MVPHFLIKVLEIISKSKHINFFTNLFFLLFFLKLNITARLIYIHLYSFFTTAARLQFLFFLTCFCLPIFGAAFEKIITSRCLDQEHNNIDSSMVPTSLNVQENSYQ